MKHRFRNCITVWRVLELLSKIDKVGCAKLDLGVVNRSFAKYVVGRARSVEAGLIPGCPVILRNTEGGNRALNTPTQATKERKKNEKKKKKKEGDENTIERQKPNEFSQQQAVESISKRSVYSWEHVAGKSNTPVATIGSRVWSKPCVPS